MAQLQCLCSYKQEEWVWWPRRFASVQQGPGCWYSLPLLGPQHGRHTPPDWLMHKPGVMTSIVKHHPLCLHSEHCTVCFVGWEGPLAVRGPAPQPAQWHDNPPHWGSLESSGGQCRGGVFPGPPCAKRCWLCACLQSMAFWEGLEYTLLELFTIWQTTIVAHHDLFSGVFVTLFSFSRVECKTASCLVAFEQILSTWGQKVLKKIYVYAHIHVHVYWWMREEASWRSSSGPRGMLWCDVSWQVGWDWPGGGPSGDLMSTPGWGLSCGVTPQGRASCLHCWTDCL